MTSSKQASSSSISRLVGANRQPPFQHRPFSDPNRLGPEDAIYTHPFPRRQRDNLAHTASSSSRSSGATITAAASVTEQSNTRVGGTSGRRRYENDRGRSRSRRRNGEWKKLLWVKQSCMSAFLFLSPIIPAAFAPFYRKQRLNPTHRSRQLHRPTNFPLPPAAQSAPPPL